MSNGFKFDTSKLLNALVSREMKTKAALELMQTLHLNY